MLDLVRAVEQIQAQVGATEADKGFRSDWEDAAYLEKLANVLAARSAEEFDLGMVGSSSVQLRRIATVLRTNIIGTKMMLMVSEISEALDSLRDTGYEHFGDGNVDEEYADVIIRILANADMLGLNVAEALVHKADKNTTRPHKHGRQL